MSEVRGQPPFDVRGFAVAPELATDAYAKLGALQDVVGEMVREAKVLGRTVPLGGGYAGEIGKFMAEYGIGGEGWAVQPPNAFGRELATPTHPAGGAPAKDHQPPGAAAERGARPGG